MYIYIYCTYDHMCARATVRCPCAVSSTDEPMTGTEGISGLASLFSGCVLGRINTMEKLSKHIGYCNQSRALVSNKWSWEQETE